MLTTFSLKDLNHQFFRMFLVLALFFVCFVSANEVLQPVIYAEDDDAFEVTGPLTVEVVLQRVYLDGEMSEEVIEEEILSMEDFWSFYDDWQLLTHTQDQVVFQQEVNDISPLLKVNGYFGLSEEGTLNIYNGKPEQDDVIQSFFQINTDRLKSKVHSDLKSGIPVSSKDHYLEVLQMYEKYSVTDM
ncbi:BofC C-terminal domain-containing protein [Alteribacter populi]|uniref:BofC C-terminal domain-containing protein n=1 Tax=Alteribacter populi TaxID=2011011 RepID=UPI001E53DEAE|nr:BofC C-terminal domain-containing protein [Alteribacter populi]